MNAFKSMRKKLKGKVKDKPKKGKKGEYVAQEADEEPELTWDTPVKPQNGNGHTEATSLGPLNTNVNGKIECAVVSSDCMIDESDKKSDNLVGLPAKDEPVAPITSGSGSFRGTTGQGTGDLGSPSYNHGDKVTSLPERVADGVYGCTTDPKGSDDATWTLDLGDIGDLSGIVDNNGGAVSAGLGSCNQTNISEGNGVDISESTNGVDISEDDAVNIDFEIDISGNGFDIVEGNGNGADIGEEFVNGGDISEEFVSGGDISEELINGGDISEEFVKGGNISKELVNGGDISEEFVNGGYISEEMINGGDISKEFVKGGDSSEELVNGGDISEEFVNGGDTSEEHLADAELTASEQSEFHDELDADQDGHLHNINGFEEDSGYMHNVFDAADLHLDLPSSDEEKEDPISDDHMPNGVAGGGSNGSGGSEQRLIGLREESSATAEAKANVTLSNLKGPHVADGGKQNVTKTETHTIEQVQKDGEDVLKVTKSVTETVSSRSNSKVTGDVSKKTVKDGTKEVTVINEGQKTTVIKHETSSTSNASKMRSPSKLPTLGSSKESPKRTTSSTDTQKKPSPRATSAGAAKSSPRAASATPKDSPRSKPEGRDLKRPTASPQKGTSPRNASSDRKGSTDSDGKSPRGAYGAVGSKCGSKTNIHHSPGGGNVKIESKKLAYKEVAKSKVGSLNNATHRPGGGDRKIESKKVEWKAESRVGSFQNATHKAGGGVKKIRDEKLTWKAEPKVGSLNNATHKPGGGEKKIESHKLDFKDKAAPKVGSKDNITHKAGGGAKKIETQKLTFRENARAKTESTSSTGSPRKSLTEDDVSEPSDMNDNNEVGQIPSDSAFAAPETETK